MTFMRKGVVLREDIYVRKGTGFLEKVYEKRYPNGPVLALC